MPWHTARSSSCPASRPFAVIKDSDGTVEGCHMTEEDAKTHMAALYANEGKEMAHKGDVVEAHITLKAVATATDQGQFSAIAAAYTVDRDKEFIRQGAFENTIKAWQTRGRPIPLHWAHKGDPENIIGDVDPMSMKETDDGLYVEGVLDLENSSLAKEAWRLVKAGTIGLSFGFLGMMGKEQKDGTREIVEVDLFEVSLTPAPANPDTRILTWKSIGSAETATVPDEATLRKQTEQLERDRIAGELPETTEPPETEAEEMFTLEEARARLIGEVKEALLAEFKANMEARAERPSEEQLRKASVTVERELVEEQLPETPDPEPGPDPVVELKAMVETLSTRLEELAQSVKKAEETDKESEPTRSVDPLRRRSERAVLEIQSDGISERRPPKQVPEPAPPEPEKDSVLRRKFEEDMLELLTGA